MASSTGQPGAVSPQTYWKRRALVLAGFLLLVAIIAQSFNFIGGEENGEPVRGDAGAEESTPTPSTTPEEPTEAASEEPEEDDESDEPSEEPSDSGEGGDGASGGGDSADFPTPERAEDACHPDDVRVTLDFEEKKGEEQTYPAGVDPSFEIVVVQSGDQDCTVDVGPEAMELRITSGDDTWFSTAHCQEGNTQENRQLEWNGHHRYIVTWDRGRTFDDCRDTDQVAGQGTYYVELHGDYADGVDKRRFLLNG